MLKMLYGESFWFQRFLPSLSVQKVLPDPVAAPRPVQDFVRETNNLININEFNILAFPVLPLALAGSPIPVALPEIGKGAVQILIRRPRLCSFPYCHRCGSGAKASRLSPRASASWRTWALVPLAPARGEQFMGMAFALALIAKPVDY
ncbi:MAG: hypothetical protein AB9872_07600 [Solidesulfovibrio sp.]